MREQVAVVDSAGIVRYTNNPVASQFKNMPVWRQTSSNGSVAYFIGTTMYSLSQREYEDACRKGAFVPVRRQPMQQHRPMPRQQPMQRPMQHMGYQQRPMPQRPMQRPVRQQPMQQRPQTHEQYMAQQHQSVPYMQKYRDDRGRIAYGNDAVTFDDTFVDTPSANIKSVNAAPGTAPDRTAGFVMSYIDQSSFFDNNEAPNWDTESLLSADKETVGSKLKASVTGAFMAIKDIPSKVRNERQSAEVPVIQRRRRQ